MRTHRVVESKVDSRVARVEGAHGARAVVEEHVCVDLPKSPRLAFGTKSPRLAFGCDQCRTAGERNVAVPQQREGRGQGRACEREREREREKERERKREREREGEKERERKRGREREREREREGTGRKGGRGSKRGRERVRATLNATNQSSSAKRSAAGKCGTQNHRKICWYRICPAPRAPRLSAQAAQRGESRVCAQMARMAPPA